MSRIGEAILDARRGEWRRRELRARLSDLDTSSEGIAERPPGPYQLTVRYAGDDAHDGSADTITFVIEKEDTDVELKIEGKGNKRTLSARLFDRGTTADVSTRWNGNGRRCLPPEGEALPGGSGASSFLDAGMRGLTDQGGRG